MTADTKATDPTFTAPLGGREFPRFVAGLGLANAIASVALFATLLVLPGARAGHVTTPAVPYATDVTAQFAGTDMPPTDGHVVGSGYVEFEPPPAGPPGAVGLSHTSIAERTH